MLDRDRPTTGCRREVLRESLLKACRPDSTAEFDAVIIRKVEVGLQPDPDK